MAVEIKTWLTKEFQCELSVNEVSQLSISALAQKIVRTSSLLIGRFKLIAEEDIEKRDKAEEVEPV